MKYLVAVIEYEIGCVDNLEEQFGDSLLGCEVLDIEEGSMERLLVDENGDLEIL